MLTVPSLDLAQNLTDWSLKLPCLGNCTVPARPNDLSQLDFEGDAATDEMLPAARATHTTATSNALDESPPPIDGAFPVDVWFGTRFLDSWRDEVQIGLEHATGNQNLNIVITQKSRFKKKPPAPKGTEGFPKQLQRWSSGLHAHVHSTHTARHPGTDTTLIRQLSDDRLSGQDVLADRRGVLQR